MADLIPQSDLLEGLPLSTRCGTRIPNHRRRIPRSPERMRAARDLWMQKFPNIQVRSLSSAYNCVGMVFASRRCWVDTPHLALILDKDGYKEVSENDVGIGDVIVYSSPDAPVHVGLIIDKKRNIEKAAWQILVLSQWGGDGEYFHNPAVVPTLFGNEYKFFSEAEL